ncbi:MAG: endonuclease/exonuclease/phosphatase family protein, partial [Ilumatobacteraceae bacterium]
MPQIVAWNIKNQLGDPEKHLDAINAVMPDNPDDWPDVAIFSKAYEEIDTEFSTVHKTQEIFVDFGYQVVHGLYDDTDGRRDRHGIMAISRLAGEVGLVSLGSRNAVKITATDKTTGTDFNVFGIHLDDRSEEQRLRQIDTLLRELVDPDKPTVIAGDLNAMHGDDTRAMLLRLIGKPAGLVKPIEPQDFAELSGAKRMRKLPARMASIAVWLSLIAEGSVMRLLEDADFVDTDPAHSPTMSAKRPIAQLDHIMVSPGFGVVEHNVQPYVGLSN